MIGGFQVTAFQPDFQEGAPGILVPDVGVLHFTGFAPSVRNSGQVITVSPGGGRPSRRRYLIRIGDQEFLTHSEPAALSVLAQARQLASHAAQQAVQAALQAPERVKELAKPPKISAPPELAREVQETRTFVSRVYKSAFADYELYALLAERMRTEDEEDIALLLM